MQKRYPRIIKLVIFIFATGLILCNISAAEEKKDMKGWELNSPYNQNYDVKEYEKPIVDTVRGIIPSACIAFRKTDVRFNEDYKGAGFEDTSFMLRMKNRYNGRVVINNECQLVHKNEAKKHSEHFAFNREVFRKEFNSHITMKVGVFGKVYFSHATFTNFLDDLVMRNGFTYHKSIPHA